MLHNSINLDDIGSPGMLNITKRAIELFETGPFLFYRTSFLYTYGTQYANGVEFYATYSTELLRWLRNLRV